MARKPKYYWWKRSDLQAFLDEALAAQPDARLEFHPADGLLYVKPPKGDVTAESHSSGHNFVHTCPPDCN